MLLFCFLSPFVTHLSLVICFVDKSFVFYAYSFYAYSIKCHHFSQGGHSSGKPGKPGKVRELKSGQGKVREDRKSQGK